MPKSDRWFVLWGGPDLRTVVQVFVLRAGSGDVESLDPVSGRMISGPRSLLAYVFDGQTGADEVSRSLALAHGRALVTDRRAAPSPLAEA